MSQNRSVPANVILPHLAYEYVGPAVSFLTEAFGFEEDYRYGPPGAPQGALMHRGDAWVMLTLARPGRMSPKQAGGWTTTLSLFVDDVHASLARAEAAGAQITEALNETMYGELQFVAADPEGHRWLFSEHARDVAPAEWGAIQPAPSR